MKNYSRKMNRRVARFGTPSSFIVRRAEQGKRRSLRLPLSRGRH